MTDAAPATDPQLEQRAVAFSEVGLTGLKRFSGLVQEEWDQRISGTKWVKVAREMADNEVTIGATLYVIEMMLRQTGWRMEPADESPQAKFYADYHKQCLEDLLEGGGWQGFNSDVLSALMYGWASIEKVYKVRRGLRAPIAGMRSRFTDGLIGWRKFGIRAQSTLHKWHFDQHGDVLGFWQSPPPDYKRRYLPRSKYMHFMLRQRSGSPEGYSLLRPIYLSYYFLKNFRIIEAIGYERNLAGLPAMQVPMAAYNDNTKRASWEKMVRSIKADEYQGIVVPAEEEGEKKTGYKFGLVTSGGRLTTDGDTIIKRYESRIMMALLTQFMLLGQDKVGSYSLADRSTDLFSLGLATILDMRDEQFNCDAIPELQELNGWPVELAPRLKHGDIEKADLNEIAQAIATLAGAGALTPDKRLEEHIREIGDLPPADPLTAVAQPGAGMSDNPGAVYGAEGTAPQ